MAPFKVFDYIVISRRAAIRMNQKARALDKLEKEISEAPIITREELESYGAELVKCARCVNVNVLCGSCITLNRIVDLAHKAGIEPPEAI